MEESDQVTGAEVEVVEGSAVEVDAAAEIPHARRSTAIWRHPDRETIHHLLRHGKSASWIQYWLEDRYPLVDEDEDGDEIEHENAAAHRRWQVSASTIESYRADWMPECAPGVSVVRDELEELIGRRLPGAVHFELEILEAGVAVTQVNLERALKADEDMGMLQQTSIDANDAMMRAADRLISAKSKLQLPGYEPAPERTINENINTNTNRNLSVALHGKIGKDGKPEPGSPDAVEMMKKMLELPAEERQQLIEDHAKVMPEDDGASTDLGDQHDDFETT